MAKINNEKRKKAWEIYHGNKTRTTNPVGRKIDINSFVVGRILQSSKGGKDDLKNLVSMHKQTNFEKGDNLIEKIKDKNVEIKKVQTRIGIFKINGKKISK